MKHRFSAVFVLIFSAAACKRDGDDEAARRAEQAATEFAQTLRSRLQAAMAAGGPVNAVSVCAEQAPLVAREVGERHHVTVGRASLRARNSGNRGPEWVRAWLLAQGERSAQGLAPHRAREGSVTRLLRPLAVEGVCVACHGARDAMPAPLRDALSSRYPDDRAVDYRPGDLRGALWVEAPAR